jgi:hypothetical protein
MEKMIFKKNIYETCTFKLCLKLWKLWIKKGAWGEAQENTQKTKTFEWPKSNYMLIATSTFKSEGENLKNPKVLNLKGGHTSPNSKTN